MRRSISQTTTHTILQMRVDRYQKALITANLVLLMMGMMQTLLGVYLCSGFHMVRLGFMSDWLHHFPLTLIGIGALTITISMTSILSAAVKNRYALAVSATMMGCLVIPMFFSTYATTKVNEDVNEEAFKLRLNLKLNNYIVNALENDITEHLENWDYVQRDLRCCGSGGVGTPHGQGFWNQIGSREVNESMRGRIGFSDTRDLRRSCCIYPDAESQAGGKICPWKNFFEIEKTKNIDAQIYRTGCLVILDIIYGREVMPMLNIYLITSMVMAVLEIAVVAMSLGYYNSLTRKQQKFGYASENDGTEMSVQ